MLQQRLADFFPTIQALLKAGLRYTTEDLQMEYKAKGERLSLRFPLRILQP